MMSTRTLVITLGNGWMVRNFVYSGLIESVAISCDVVLVIPRGSAIDVDRSWVPQSGSIEVVAVQVSESTPKRRVRRLKKLLFEARAHLSTPRLRYRRRLSSRLAQTLVGVAYDFLAYTPRMSLVMLESLETRLTRVTGLPRLDSEVCVLLTNIALDWDSSIARHASRFGCRLLGAPGSWDHLTSKGVLPSVVAEYLVWSFEQKRELLRLYPDIRPARVRVVGAPQLDIHFAANVDCSPLRLPVGRPIVTYFTTSPRSATGEPILIKRLAVLLKEHWPECLLIVRCHPFDLAARYDIEPDSNVRLIAPSLPPEAHAVAKDGLPLDEEINLARHFDVRREFLLSELWVPSRSDLWAASCLIRASTVTISAGSSTLLDAVMCGKSQIMVGFSASASPYHDVPSPLTGYDHLQLAFSHGVMPIADSWEALAKLVLSHRLDDNHISAFARSPLSSATPLAYNGPERRAVDLIVEELLG